jgi:hypothetical protein
MPHPGIVDRLKNRRWREHPKSEQVPVVFSPAFILQLVNSQKRATVLSR